MNWIRAVLATIVVFASGISACTSQDEGRARGTEWTRTFYWGTATAGFQAEGNAPDSNWRRYADRSMGRPGPFGGDPVDPYANADDFRHRYREDIANAHAMGINTFRFSVEWALVMPEPGQWDDSELAY